MDWIVTPEGALKVSWLKKIAEFQEKNSVLMTLTDESGNEINASKTAVEIRGTADELRIGGLRFGAKYSVHLKDLDQIDDFGPFVIQACK